MSKDDVITALHSLRLSHSLSSVVALSVCLFFLFLLFSSLLFSSLPLTICTAPAESKRCHCDFSQRDRKRLRRTNGHRVPLSCRPGSRRCQSLRERRGRGEKCPRKTEGERGRDREEKK